MFETVHCNKNHPNLCSVRAVAFARGSGVPSCPRPRSAWQRMRRTRAQTADMANHPVRTLSTQVPNSSYHPKYCRARIELPLTSLFRQISESPKFSVQGITFPWTGVADTRENALRHNWRVTRVQHTKGVPKRAISMLPLHMSAKTFTVLGKRTQAQVYSGVGGICAHKTKHCTK